MTGIYIKLPTLEYPRHMGDIQLDPNGQYEPVEWVDPPEVDFTTQRCYEGAPININGVWKMTWITEDLVSSTKEII